MSFIPEKLYVTFQDRQNHILGFMSPFEDNAAFRKRRKTQLEWAYTGSGFIEPDADLSGNLFYKKWGRYADLKDLGGEIIQPSDFDPTAPNADDDWCCVKIKASLQLEPKVLDNIPATGFAIGDDIQRSGGWFSNKNVVWRVLDPRGFQLEISSANLSRLLGYATLVNGVIQEKCVWAREGSANVLIPEGSDLYEELVESTNKKKFAKKLSLKDIDIGDIVTLLTDSDVEYRYLGLLRAIYRGKPIRVGSSYNDIPQETSIIDKVVPVHCFLSAGNYLVLRSSPDIGSVEKISGYQVSDREGAAKFLNELMISRKICLENHNYYRLLGFSASSSLKVEHLKAEFKPASAEYIETVLKTKKPPTTNIAKHYTYHRPLFYTTDIGKICLLAWWKQERLYDEPSALFLVNSYRNSLHENKLLFPMRTYTRNVSRGNYWTGRQYQNYDITAVTDEMLEKIAPDLKELHVVFPDGSTLPVDFLSLMSN